MMSRMADSTQQASVAGWEMLNTTADKMKEPQRSRFVALAIPAESEFSRGSITKRDYELLLIAACFASAKP
jgi:hypothetical protein